MSRYFLSTTHYSILHTKKASVFLKKVEIYIMFTDFGRKKYDLLVIIFKRSDLLCLFLVVSKP